MRFCWFNAEQIRILLKFGWWFTNPIITDFPNIVFDGEKMNTNALKIDEVLGKIFKHKIDRYWQDFPCQDPNIEIVGDSINPEKFDRSIVQNCWSVFLLLWTTCKPGCQTTKLRKYNILSFSSWKWCCDLDKKWSTVVWAEWVWPVLLYTLFTWSWSSTKVTTKLTVLRNIRFGIILRIFGFFLQKTITIESPLNNQISVLSELINTLNILMKVDIPVAKNHFTTRKMTGVLRFDFLKKNDAREGLHKLIWINIAFLHFYSHL